jgi:benzoyl-CoA reductase/2-hydroxyglutaryl-CoA dehydratase subunit BcrC/BadD/HgdB
LDFKSIISGIDADFEKYTEAARLFKNTPPGLVDHAVRVLMTGVPMVHGAERVLDIIESSGGLVVCMDNCTGLKPIWEDVDESIEDPIQALAEKYFRIPCSVMTRNDRRLDLIREMAGAYHPQCVVDLIWQACLTYDVESYRVKRLVEEELGLPYLRIETDYSPSDSARIALRVEALFETVRQRI